MKRIIISMLICLTCVSTAISQEKSKVVKVETQMEDINNLLHLMKMNMYRFDLSSFLNDKYTMYLYIDEYINNEKVKRSNTIWLGDNIGSLEDISKKARDGYRELKQVPEGENEWDNIKELSIYTRIKNDSTAIIAASIPDVVLANREVSLYPISDEKVYFYTTIPFAFQEIKDKKRGNIEIPLILYGSWWFDTKYKTVRFCGENEIDYKMKADILKDIPHHYIVGLELKKVEDIDK